MKASKRVRLGLAMLRFAASLDLTFLFFRCYHYSQDTANRDKHNQAFLATPYFMVLLEHKIVLATPQNAVLLDLKH